MLVGINCMVWLLMSLSLLTQLTGPFLTALWVVLVCLFGSGGGTLLTTVRCVLGSNWQLVLVSRGVGMGGIPQGCPLSMVFTVALYVPWCRCLESLTDVRPQLYADNLKCSAQCPTALFDAARFTARYVRAVGQDTSPGKCVSFLAPPSRSGKL